jgi:hypothetical protein
MTDNLIEFIQVSILSTKRKSAGLVCSSVVKGFPSMSEARSLIPSTKKKKKIRKNKRKSATITMLLLIL